ncbi:hypothetical protein GWI33_014863 [Rhynchophorus ferrugineus]|uniref:Uncharacterized protein n=1 Tax=Rhynchophorus ferrugineus TaxID=354439 RepID=A0A834I3L8_RHYFE|nr:hypothetical protein GWI33_014863 [Rhynchophorus ferrugineus]
MIVFRLATFPLFRMLQIIQVQKEFDTTREVRVPEGTRVRVPDHFYYCKICGKSYRVARSLWRHQKYECQQEPKFKCPHCFPSLKTRHIYQPSQVRYLEKSYTNFPYITHRQRTDIANTLGLTERQVQIWFQNRRRRGIPKACMEGEN